MRIRGVRKIDPPNLPLTPIQYRALRILDEAEGDLAPREFAREMWPDSPAHNVKRPAVTGAAGSGLWYAAGGYLGKLVKRKLVERIEGGYRLRCRGLLAVIQYEKEIGIYYD